MAGLTTSATLKPLSFSKTTPSSSFSDSKLFGLRLRNPNDAIFKLSSLASHASSVVAAATVITSRYGGGGGGGGSRYSGNNPRQSRNAEPDDEGALDLSIIKSDSVRLIDVQQNMVGIVSKAEAIRMADDSELDLVVLSPDADPPVVRIMDYNKYRYELQKKKREQQKKSAASRMDLKELKMGYNIDQHDYSVRLRSARKFLKDGDKVKVVVSLKGRENEFRNFAIELIRRFQTDVGELASEEAKNFRDRNIFIILVPNKAVLQKAQEPPKKKEKSDAVDEEVSASV